MGKSWLKVDACRNLKSASGSSCAKDVETGRERMMLAGSDRHTISLVRRTLEEVALSIHLRWLRMHTSTGTGNAILTCSIQNRQVDVPVLYPVQVLGLLGKGMLQQLQLQLRLPLYVATLPHTLPTSPHSHPLLTLSLLTLSSFSLLPPHTAAPCSGQAWPAQTYSTRAGSNMGKSVASPTPKLMQTCLTANMPTGMDCTLS